MVNAQGAGGIQVGGNLQQTSDYGYQPLTGSTQDILQYLPKVTVQGGALRTCTFDEAVSRVTIYLKTECRPVNATVDLWQGPESIPQKMTVYLEEGNLRQRYIFDW